MAEPIFSYMKIRGYQWIKKKRDRSGYKTRKILMTKEEGGADGILGNNRMEVYGTEIRMVVKRW